MPRYSRLKFLGTNQPSRWKVLTSRRSKPVGVYNQKLTQISYSELSGMIFQITSTEVVSEPAAGGNFLETLFFVCRSVFGMTIYY